MVMGDTMKISVLKRNCLEIVKKFDNSPIYFVEENSFFGGNATTKILKFKDLLKYIDMVHIKAVSTHVTIRSVEYRVEMLLRIAYFEFDSYSKGERQCYVGANRSAHDIYRMYKFYFPKSKITLFRIMKALYSLNDMLLVDGTFCHDIEKTVFWPSYGINITHEEEAWTCDNELGIPFGRWGEL